MASLGLRACSAAVLLAGALLSAGAGAQAPDMRPGDELILAVGAFDFENPERTALFEVDYLPGALALPLAWPLAVDIRPFVTGMVTGDGGGHVGGGFALFFDLGAGLSLMPFGGAGAYFAGNGIELGARTEFRSGLELGYAPTADGRFAIGIHHISNAGLDAFNPGANSLFFRYAFTFGR